MLGRTLAGGGSEAGRYATDGLADSKILKRAQREALIAGIQESSDLGLGWVTSAEVDELGLTGAMQLAVRRALEAIDAEPSEAIIMDGSFNYCAPKYTQVTCVVKADATYPIVSAASIFAKVSRDQKMGQFAEQYPGYGFENHVGYGTKTHLLALQQFGITALHRRSYKPIQAFL